MGPGLACRGEVALIVANRGLAMGVLGQEVMTPVIITVVACAVLTPVLLKLVFRKETVTQLQESGLADRYREVEQLDILSADLLEKNRQMMQDGNKKK